MKGSDQILYTNNTSEEISYHLIPWAERPRYGGNTP